MWVKFLLLFFVFSFLFKTDQSFDQDLGRHIKLGEIILQTNQVPKTNLFSYTSPDFPFINTHWFFELIAYLFYKIGALQVLLIIKIVIFLLSVGLTAKIIPKQNQALLLPAGFIFLHVLRERTELRPEIFSFLFTSLTYYILEKYLRGPTKLIYLLPFIQLIWINTHIYFFVGLVLQVIFIIHTLFQNLRFRFWVGKLKLPGIILALSVLVSLINPNGLTGFLYPLNVNQNYGYTIVENQTMFLLESIGFRDPNFLFVKSTWGIAALSFLVVLLKKKFELKNILLTLSGVGLALLNVRSFPYLVFLSLPAVMAGFGEIRKNNLTKLLSLIFAGLLLLESFFYLNGSYYKYRDEDRGVKLELVESGKGAMDFVLTSNLPQPIFNNFDIGSYIIYRSYPKHQVFVDGRPEAYPREFFQTTYIPIQSDYAIFKEAEKQFSFQTIIFSHTDQTPWGRAFLQNVVKDNDWNLVYIDDFMVVLTKGDFPKIDLNKLDPKDYKFNNHVSYLRMAIFLLSTGNLESSKAFLQKSLQIFPQSPVANAIIGRSLNNYFFW